MKRSVTVLLTAVAALTLLLLFVNLEAARTFQQSNSVHSIGRAGGNPKPVGSQLNLYLAGSNPFNRYMQPEIVKALQAKEIPFQQVALLDQLPADAYENPALIIRIDDENGFWTPIYATRRIKATIFYLQGRPIERARVLATKPGPLSFSMANCSGACVDAVRNVDLRLKTVGLVSLPAMRSRVAAELAKEAVILVSEGVPEQMNPERWAGRARALAEAKIDVRHYGSSFQRLAGCRGGVMAAYDAANGSTPRAVMYYDATQDAITGTLSESDLESGPPAGPPASGPTAEGLRFYLGGTRSLVIPAGSCGLTGWQITQ